jgi:Ras family
MGAFVLSLFTMFHNCSIHASSDPIFLQLAKNVTVLSHLRTPGLLTLHSFID